MVRNVVVRIVVVRNVVVRIVAGTNCLARIVVVRIVGLPSAPMVEGANYEFSRFSKCENDVITWRGVGNFEWKLVVGGQRLSMYAKNQISKPSSLFNQLET